MLIFLIIDQGCRVIITIFLWGLLQNIWWHHSDFYWPSHLLLELHLFLVLQYWLWWLHIVSLWSANRGNLWFLRSLELDERLIILTDLIPTDSLSKLLMYFHMIILKRCMRSLFFLDICYLLSSIYWFLFQFLDNFVLQYRL